MTLVAQQHVKSSQSRESNPCLLRCQAESLELSWSSWVAFSRNHVSCSHILWVRYLERARCGWDFSAAWWRGVSWRDSRLEWKEQRLQEALLDGSFPDLPGAWARFAESWAPLGLRSPAPPHGSATTRVSYSTVTGFRVGASMRSVWAMSLLSASGEETCLTSWLQGKGRRCVKLVKADKLPTVGWVSSGLPQWLRLCSPHVGHSGSIAGRGARLPRATTNQITCWN